ncbi:MAG: sensor histidine kinase [Kiritimatiellia bacterium]
MKAVPLLLLALWLAPAGRADDAALASAAELTRALSRQQEDGRRFSIRAVATLSCRENSNSFPVADETGAAIIRKEHGPLCGLRVAAGDVLRISGELRRDSSKSPLYAHGLAVERLGRTAAPPVTVLDPRKLESADYDYRPVQLRGVVRDLMADEIDPDFVFVVVRCQDVFLPIPLSARGELAARGRALIGSTIDLTGVCDPTHIGFRAQIGKCIYPISEADVVITENPGDDEFAAPDVGRLAHLSPGAISRQDRHCAHGKTIAVLHDRTFVLKTSDGRFVAVKPSQGELPRYGDCVDAVGFPESDLYRINLVRAVWRSGGRCEDVPDEPVACTSPRALLADERGRMRFDSSAYGATVRIRGVVHALPSPEDKAGLFGLFGDGYSIPVDASAVAGAARSIGGGCEIEVTGTCILESEAWRPNLVFPKIVRAIVVPRYASDIRLVSRPSWWTVGRLLPVVGALAALLCVILAWNVTLRRLAARRGRELFKSQIAKVSSELRIGERMRLAVELHDSVTQNLTGVTLQLDAAADARAADPKAADALLAVARRALQSCLDELRRFLWDLRSEALETTDFNEAIRIALRHIAARADIAVRFNVSRSRLCYATAHAILQIVRELTINAIRHGKATKVRIVGEMLPDRIRFAVTDNGSGFDPAAAQGPDEGHFGLNGIRERLKNLHGVMNLASAPGQGARAEISIFLPQRSCTP